MIMKAAMGIATKNLAASGNESLRGARLSANCDQVGTQAAEEGDRFTATRASDTDARSSQCLDPTPLQPLVTGGFGASENALISP
jgi:hypothetical protein